MPSPQLDDPLRCPGSDRTDYEVRSTYFDDWFICPECKRALRRIHGAHRVRSRTTASLDKTRDILAKITPAEIASATATDTTRRTT